MSRKSDVRDSVRLLGAPAILVFALSACNSVLGVEELSFVEGDVTELFAGSNHTCALLTSGNLRCWGEGAEGQLGYGDVNTIGNNEVPASVGNVELGGPVSRVSAGGKHTCVLLTSGGVRCWGEGSDGQLGYGNTDRIGDDEQISSSGDVDVGGSVQDIATGARHSCALLSGGKIRCWGEGQFGKLGYGNTIYVGDRDVPASTGDVDTGGVATQVAAGADHTCALLSSGEVVCWGLGGQGQLGYGNSNNSGASSVPSVAGTVELGARVEQIATGSRHTCALLSGGTVRCWGDGSEGQLGYGNTISIGDDEEPSTAGDVDVGGAVTQIAAGRAHTCALLSGGTVRCWGDGSEGQLGYGNTISIGDDEEPSTAGDVEVGDSVTQIVTASRHTCALLKSGGVRCWGAGDLGRLGYGDTESIGDKAVPKSTGELCIIGTESDCP
jgi:alpha-tubulin suppressor-like RCC1 family protein